MLEVLITMAGNGQRAKQPHNAAFTGIPHFQPSFLASGLPSNTKIRGGNPGAKKIHAAGKNEQAEDYEINAAAKWNKLFHLFLSVNVFGRF